MISVNELRIGNWVSNGDFNYIVDINSLWDAATLEYYPLEPIPLKPEILDRCGFIKNENSNEYWTHWVLPNKWYISEAHHSEKSAGVEIGKFYWSEVYMEVKYLHQLQNLYFALTCNELKINL